MKYKIAVFYVLRYGGDFKYNYHIITWEIKHPGILYETILYYHPRKRLSHHYILHLPGTYIRYPKDRDILEVFKLVLETRVNIKEATKIVEYERTI